LARAWIGDGFDVLELASQPSPPVKTNLYFCPPDGLCGAPLVTGRSGLASGTCLGKNASLTPMVSPMANIASQKSQLVRSRSKTITVLRAF
jgi:hypothetical protein